MTTRVLVTSWLLPLLWVVLAIATLTFVLSNPSVLTVSAAVSGWCGGVVTCLLLRPLVVRAP